jgi:hypothetical protein
MTLRALIVIPVNQDGIMEGENTYTSGPGSVAKLSPAELPQEYPTLARAPE